MIYTLLAYSLLIDFFTVIKSVEVTRFELKYCLEG